MEAVSGSARAGCVVEGTDDGMLGGGRDRGGSVGGGARRVLVTVMAVAVAVAVAVAGGGGSSGPSSVATVPSPVGATVARGVTVPAPAVGAPTGRAGAGSKPASRYRRTRAGLAPLSLVLPGGCVVEDTYVFLLRDDAGVGAARRLEGVAVARGATIVSRYREGAPYGFTARLSRAALRAVRREREVATVDALRGDQECVGADRHVVPPKPPTPPRRPGQLAPVNRVPPGSPVREGEYLVILRDGKTAADADRVERAARDHGAQILSRFRLPPVGFGARMSDAALAVVRRDLDVDYIDENAVGSFDAVQTGAPWGLDRIDQRHLPLNGTFVYAAAGAGVTAYVVDSGVRTTHQQSGGRAVFGYNAVNDGRTDDCAGHGTQVAGTIGGSAYGVAKQVGIVAVRVGDCDHDISEDDAREGVDYVRAVHQVGQPAVANLSFGYDHAVPMLEESVSALIAEGVTVVASAGNDARNACVHTPARVAAALTVGATTIAGPRASYSNFGPCVDLFAPGDGIPTASSASDTAIATVSGTSVAAPHVAGVAAAYLQDHPSAFPSTVHAQIAGSATSGVVSNAGMGSPNRLLFGVGAPESPAAEVRLEVGVDNNLYPAIKDRAMTLTSGQAAMFTSNDVGQAGGRWRVR